MRTRTEKRPTLPAWSYLPLAMLGAGAVLWRTGGFDPATSVTVPALLAPEQDLFAGGMATAPEAAAPVFEEPAVDTEVDAPVAFEDPSASVDPDVRAEAAAVRVALDEEWAGDVSALPD